MDRANIKIMVVNDKLELRAIIRDYLRNDGYTNLSVSENGLSALRKIAAEPPDLIIADYNLPGLGGLDLLKAVRRDNSLKDIPFILISSETERQYVAQAAELGVSAFVVKPFTYQTLADKVERLMQYKLNPPESHLYYQEANRLSQAGSLETALERYRQALASAQGTMAAIHYKVGQVHEQLNLEEDAVTDYFQAVGLSDLYVPAYDALGRLKLRREGPEAALEYLKRSTEISPLNALRQLRLAEALLETGHFEEAEKAFKHALELDPTQTHLFNRIGIALRRQGKQEEAAVYFLKAIEATPEDENLYYNLSRVYLDQKKKDLALTYLNKALELNPDFTEARELIERMRSTPAS
ncbi:MAG: tetratricopeptide repeat protein [Thermodesulfobacteriota bacterium]